MTGNSSSVNKKMLDATKAKCLLEQLRLAWFVRWELYTKYSALSNKNTREYFDNWNWTDNFFPLEEDPWKDLSSLTSLEPLSGTLFTSPTPQNETLPSPESNPRKRQATSSSPKTPKRAKDESAPETLDLSPELQRLAKQLNFFSENEDDLRSYHLVLKREQFEGFKRIAHWENSGRQGPQPLNPLSSQFAPEGYKQDGEMWIVKGDNEPFRCAYPNCFYRSNRRNNLQRHLTTMHALLKRPNCCCGTHFFAKFDYREHIKHKHTISGYGCEICNKVFNRKALYDRHVKTHDPGSRFICLLCRYATHHKGNMERHTKVHSNGGQSDEENNLFKEEGVNVLSPELSSYDNPFNFPLEFLEPSLSEDLKPFQLLHSPLQQVSLPFKFEF